MNKDLRDTIMSIGQGFSTKSWMPNVDYQEVCNFCGEEVAHLTPEAIAYCGGCDRVVEGHTHMVFEEAK